MKQGMVIYISEFKNIMGWVRANIMHTISLKTQRIERIERLEEITYLQRGYLFIL